MSGPHGGDTVEVKFKGEWIAGGHPDGGDALKVGDETLRVPFTASVEVLERANNLCGVYEGMTGIQCQLPNGHIMPDGALRTVHEGTTTAEQTEYVGYEMFVRWPADSGVWTPAAEAEKPVAPWEPGPRQSQVREYPEVSGAGVPYPPSESVPGQDLCRQDECPAAPRCSSGATVWHTRTPQCTGQPRRFRYFTKKNYLLHRVTPDGTVQFRHPDDGWTDVAPPNTITVPFLESSWDEVGDVEPIGGGS